MNWLADFNQSCMDITWGHDVELIRFGDLDLVFNISVGLTLSNLIQKVLVCTISHELVGGF